MLICLLVCLFLDLSAFVFNHGGTPTESSPENFVNIRLDLAEILRSRKLDWHDRGGKEKGRWEGILLCNGLITFVSSYKSPSCSIVFISVLTVLRAIPTHLDHPQDKQMQLAHTKSGNILKKVVTVLFKEWVIYQYI